MSKPIIVAVRAAVLTFIPAAAAAWVYSQTHHAVDKEAHLHGSVYYGFYDYGNGWYGIAAITAFLFAFAIVGMVMPRHGRKNRKPTRV